MTAKREAQARQAVYLAEGGLEWAKAQLKVNPSWTGGTVTISGKQVLVTTQASGGGYWVTAKATTGFAQREIKVFVENTTGKWKMTQYQELHR